MRLRTLSTMTIIGLAVSGFGCGEETSNQPRRVILNPGALKADGTNSCKGNCGGQATSGCWCDDSCSLYGDCCTDHSAACAKQPKTCGAFLGGECAKGEICDIKSCGVGAQGICTKQPASDQCIELMMWPSQPVCGCDGKTYGNNCERLAAGVALSHGGTCEPKTCYGDAECGANAFCQFKEGQCLLQTTNILQGVCQAVPESCIELMMWAVQPVCGCDGKTYGSICDAQAAKTSVAKKGECSGNPPTPTTCGGVAGIKCPTGQKCKLQGSNPDASGTCVDFYNCDEAKDCADIPVYYLCIGDWQCINNNCTFMCE